MGVLGKIKSRSEKLGASLSSFSLSNVLDKGDGEPTGDVVALLRGVLHIKIIKCTGLRNFDRRLRGGDLSDPYVVASLDADRILKTRTIWDNLSPVFEEEFYCHVAHETRGVTFAVYDKDLASADDKLGKYFLDVRELTNEEEDGFLQSRVGVHKTVFLDGNKKHGSLEFFIEYVPARMLGKTLAVPGIYFDATVGNDVTYYMNADDDGSAPSILYGGQKVNAKNRVLYDPPRLWRDIYDAICGAKHFVYVVGWSVDVDQTLLRGDEMHGTVYDPRIGPLLKAKADEGLKVNLMQWDDYSSNMFLPGKMGTHDEKTRNYFVDTKVNAQFVPTVGDETNSVFQGQNKKMVFTHHQKFIIVDASKNSNNSRSGASSSEREMLAFVGGIDLTEGRWDNRQHSLFRNLNTIFDGDVYNKCFRFKDKKIGPRQPWHDIHSSVRGPEALHLMQAFHERWTKQVPKGFADLINPASLKFTKKSLTKREGWHCQLSRSIDARTNDFDNRVLDKMETRSVDDMAGKVYWETGRSQHIGERSRRFESANADFELEFKRVLDQKKGRAVDISIQITNIHHIRRAKHFIYIESQCFLGSSHMWQDPIDRKVKCNNLIAAELAYKICEKITNGERFVAYILLPMWCEGLPDGAPNQEIFFWQWSTIQGLYAKVQDAIDRRHASSSERNLKISDYLNFYCLGNRETLEGGETTGTPTTPNEILLSKTRRHQIYIHLKFMIVDDEVALIGTANINQRSMDGCRDTEIMMTSWHPDHLATDKSTPTGDIHGYRLHIWASITNEIHDSFRDPKSLKCVRKMNEIAAKNWEKYFGEETVEMDSHLLPLPLEYFEKERDVRPRKELIDGVYPDTRAPVKGKKSFVFPDIILT